VRSKGRNVVLAQNEYLDALEICIGFLYNMRPRSMELDVLEEYLILE